MCNPFASVILQLVEGVRPTGIGLSFLVSDIHVSGPTDEGYIPRLLVYPNYAEPRSPSSKLVPRFLGRRVRSSNGGHLVMKTIEMIA